MTFNEKQTSTISCLYYNILTAYWWIITIVSRLLIHVFLKFILSYNIIIKCSIWIFIDKDFFLLISHYFYIGVRFYLSARKIFHNSVYFLDHQNLILKSFTNVNISVCLIEENYIDKFYFFIKVFETFSIKHNYQNPRKFVCSKSF